MQTVELCLRGNVVQFVDGEDYLVNVVFNNKTEWSVSCRIRIQNGLSSFMEDEPPRELKDIVKIDLARYDGFKPHITDRIHKLFYLLLMKAVYDLYLHENVIRYNEGYLGEVQRCLKKIRGDLNIFFFDEFDYTISVQEDFIEDLMQVVRQ